jgi:hypothetical protein
VMVVLRPCEAKLSGLRCLTIIGTEGNVSEIDHEVRAALTELGKPDEVRPDG